MTTPTTRTAREITDAALAASRVHPTAPATLRDEAVRLVAAYRALFAGARNPDAVEHRIRAWLARYDGLSSTSIRALTREIDQERRALAQDARDASEE